MYNTVQYKQQHTNKQINDMSAKCAIESKNNIDK